MCDYYSVACVLRQEGYIVGIQALLIGCDMVNSVKKMIRFEAIEKEGVGEGAKKPKSS